MLTYFVELALGLVVLFGGVAGFIGGCIGLGKLWVRVVHGTEGVWWHDDTYLLWVTGLLILLCVGCGVWLSWVVGHAILATPGASAVLPPEAPLSP